MNIINKTIIKTLAFGFIGLFFSITSCRKALDKVPLSQYSSEGFWKSENDAFLALTAVYRGNIQQLDASNADVEFTPTDWWSYHGMVFLELATDNMYDRRGDNSALNKLTNGTLVSSNTYISAFWNFSYLRIARCNYFLENVNRVPASADKIKRWTAEAKFIRAAVYFYMSQYWGDVPLVTKVLSVDEANNVKKNTKKEIVDFVISELTSAIVDLPQYKDITSSEKGRASKQAALAFLGRMQLSEKKYSDAAATYKQIIDYNDNVIDPDYKGLFNGTNEYSKEIIFATQYQQDFLSNGILLHISPAVVGGYHFANPLGSLVESYQFTDGTAFSFSDPRYNPLDMGANRDPRLKYTIFYNLETITESSSPNTRYISHPDSSKSPDQLTLTKQATRTGFGFRKVMPPSLPANLANSGIDLPIIRYAEILLSYLEAKLENGDAINQALLDATINKVRSRASVNMPAITETDPPKLRVILRNERRLELACEGLRLWDLLRWGIAAQVLNGDFYGASFPGALNLRKKGSIVDPYSRWYVTTKAFRAGVDEKWPIPQKEQDINPNLR